MWDISTCLHKLISYWVRWRHFLPFNTKMSGNFIIVAHLLGVIGSPRAPKMGSDHPLQSRGLNGSQWQVSFMGPLGSPEAGDRWWDSSWSETLTVHNTTSMQLLLFQPSSVLSSQTPVSHSRITATGAPLSYQQRFVKILLFFFSFPFSVFSQSPPHALSVCATHAQSPVLWFVEEVYFCHKRNKNKARELMPAA